MRWEYKILKLSASHGFWGGKFDEEDLTARMNEMGDQRWELVSALTTSQGHGQSRDIVAMFKREKR